MKMWSTVRTVLWSFLGVRSALGRDRDTEQANIFAIVFVAFVAVTVFVAGLMAVVHFII